MMISDVCTRLTRPSHSVLLSLTNQKRNIRNEKDNLSAILGATLLTSCQNMDIPPKNIVTSDDLLSSESGMDIYMARMYSIMPFEDFKYLPREVSVTSTAGLPVSVSRVSARM